MNPRAAPLQADWAAALLDPDRPPPPGLRVWNGSDPARRFAVHRNNVVASLVSALADGFPVVQALVGEEFFRAMGAVFVRAHPPRSPVLAHYGADFPAFVAAFAPARALPYLADVARLEQARAEAAQARDAAPLTAHAAAAALACGERIGVLRLLPHPALRIVASPHAVVALWAAHQGEGRIEDVDPAQPQSALVVRPQDEVLVVPCDAATAAFAEALQHGLPLAEAAAHAAAQAPLDLAAALSLLMAQGALAAIELPPENPA